VTGSKHFEGRSNRDVYTAAVIPSQVQQHIEVLLSGLETRMLVVGNINKDEAITLAKMTDETIPASPLLGICPVDLSLKLPEGLS
jgi:secreted Zn-dependent insulinase-like peptidase